MSTDPTTDRATLLARIADVASDLCDPHQHVEPVHDTDTHGNRRLRRAFTTTQPGLLTQLRDAAFPAGVGTAVMGGHAGSRPPGNIDAISLYATISAATSTWCWNTHTDMRDTTEANIRALVGASPNMPSDQSVALLDDLRRWRTWASTATGWSTPPITPRTPCPVCGNRSTLRINLERRTAYCRGVPERPCDAVWDSEHIEALAAAVEAHLNAGRGQARVARLRARAEREERERRYRPHPAA